MEFKTERQNLEVPTMLYEGREGMIRRVARLGQVPQ